MHHRRLRELGRYMVWQALDCGHEWSVVLDHRASLARRSELRFRCAFNTPARCARYVVASLDETAANAQHRHPAPRGRPAMWPVVFPAGITDSKRL